MARTAHPTDPFFAFQWYLQNTATTARSQPLDLDLPRAWADYRGRGVDVAVIELNPVQPDHPDLPQGFPRFSAVESGPPTVDAGPHPTAVAGIIAGRWNGIGIAGIAPEAGIGSYVKTTTEQAAVAINRAVADGMEVLNNSWGFDGRNFVHDSGDPGEPLTQALRAAATTGRDGLGSVIVWAGGNERQIGSDSGLDGATGSRFSIAVAALDREGVVAGYSNPGANILVSGFGGPAGLFAHDVPGNRITTTDVTGSAGYNSRGTNQDYTFAFDGTSAAAPMVSGIVALMLEANPLLGYRQVAEILAMTARIPALGDGSAAFNGNNTWNGQSSLYSRDWGFGLADAHGAVRVAEAMRAVRTEARSEFNIDMVEIQGTRFGNFWEFGAPAIDVERVELDLNGIIRPMPDVRMTLVAPGAVAVALLREPTALATVNYRGEGTVISKTWPEEGFVLQTPAFWGHPGAGRWTLDIADAQHQLEFATLRLWGKPAADPFLYHFTDDIGALAAREGRDLFVLPPTTREITFNGAALSGDLVLDFNPNPEGGDRLQSANGVTLRTRPDENWRNAWGGDGDDRFIGNATDNLFYGGRGFNVISGGDGTDIAAFLGGRAAHNVFAIPGGQLVLGRDGTSALDGIERLRFEEGEFAAGDMTDAALVAASLYGALLERRPDRPGFEHWQAALNEGVGRDAMDLRGVAQGFLASGEFVALHGSLSNAQFVALLYDGFFGRTGDPTGAAHWEAALGAGASRAELVAGFVLSDEFQTVTLPRLADQMVGWLV